MQTVTRDVIEPRRLSAGGPLVQSQSGMPQRGDEMELADSFKSPAVNNICLLGQGFSTNNFGVHALSTGTISSLRNAFPQARFCFLDYDTFPAVYQVQIPGGPVTVPMLNIRFSKKLYLANHIGRLLFLGLVGRAIPFAGLREKFYARNPYLRQIQDSDFVAALGGGDSFSDIYGQQRLWCVVLPQILVLLMQRPLVLLPQTIGPFDTALGRFLARWILRRARRICTRDTESLDEVTRLLGYKPDQAALAYDMGFALDPMPPSEQVQEQIRGLRQQHELVGLNVSGLLYAGGYTGQNQFGLKSDYREIVRRLIALLIERHGMQVLLVPHVVGGPEDGESDITACNQIAAESGTKFKGRLHQLPDTLDHHQTKWVIGQCDFFIGSRMHACIAAISQGVPAMGLAYSRKFAGVFGSIDATNLVVDLTQLDLPEVLTLVEQQLQRRNDLRKNLRSVAPRLRQAVLDLFKDKEQSALKEGSRA